MHDSLKWNSDSEFLLDTDNYFTNDPPYLSVAINTVII